LIKPRRIGASALVAGVLFCTGIAASLYSANSLAQTEKAQQTAPAAPVNEVSPQPEAPALTPQTTPQTTPQASPQTTPQTAPQATAPATAPATSADNNPASFGASYIMQTTLGLLFVLALLMALAWVLKRAGFAGRARNNQFYKVLAVSSLGPKEKIALLEVGETWLLVGMTPGSINTLHSMPKGSLEYDPQSNAAVTFAKLLERVKKPNSIQK
jgi:flagellar protein FliO/FliZ